jgi:hypothetical protein
MMQVALPTARQGNFPAIWHFNGMSWLAGAGQRSD